MSIESSLGVDVQAHPGRLRSLWGRWDALMAAVVASVSGRGSAGLRPWHRSVVTARGVLTALALVGTAMLEVGTSLAQSQGEAAAAEPKLRVAVTELRNEAELGNSEVAYLTDQVRNQASIVLPKSAFAVITKESMQMLLPPDKFKQACSGSQCEVEVGRTMGAQYIISGEVIKFGGSLRVNLKVHACVSGEFLGLDTARGTLDELEEAIKISAANAMDKVLKSANFKVASSNNSNDNGQPGVLPAQRTVIKFLSNPEGAMVLDGNVVLCQGTPCSKALSVGVHRITMQKERYLPRTEVYTVSPPGASLETPRVPVNWTLSPRFGWLSVYSEPAGLAVRLDGEVIGETPIARRETDPGGYLIELGDARYLPSSERIVVESNSERAVNLRAVAREGLIDVSAVDERENDLDAEVFVDDVPFGPVPAQYRLIVGRHSLTVRYGGMDWQGEVEVSERQVATVRATFRLGSGGFQYQADVKPPVDNGTLNRLGQNHSTKDVLVRDGLMWLRVDNGREVNADQAIVYAGDCTAGGFSDWRLPTIEELRTLYEPTSKNHVISGMDLKACSVWSADRPRSGVCHAYDFCSGKTRTDDRAFRSIHRVLLVRVDR